MRAASFGAAFVVLAFFALLVADVVMRGAAELSPTYLFSAAEEGGRAGGIGPVLVSTLLVVLLATLFALPVAAGGALLCSELLVHRQAWKSLVRRSFEILVSAPSVAIGLIGWSLFGQLFGLGFSILSGAATLAFMLAPLMALAFLAGLEAVPQALRAQSLALGVSRWRTLLNLVIPAARPALVAGVMLAVGRAMAETAVLVLTSGISTRMPQDVFDPGATLAVHVYHLAHNLPGGEPRAYAAALALLLVSALVQLGLARLRVQEQPA
ncbi:MAG: ABC transporter permease subunit [Planctomycetes bacterium]|nr:ABC transporter permease subunit [Planctomycetota bacterium]